MADRHLQRALPRVEYFCNIVNPIKTGLEIQMKLC